MSVLLLRLLVRQVELEIVWAFGGDDGFQRRFQGGAVAGGQDGLCFRVGRLIRRVWVNDGLADADDMLAQDASVACGERL